jgi:hypothetical protein
MQLLKRTVFLTNLLFCFCLFSDGLFLFAQTKNENLIRLSLNIKKFNDIKIKQLGTGHYEISTTGNDPYIYTHNIQEKFNADTFQRFSFESFSLKKINNIQVFILPPLSEQHSISGYNIESSEAWVPNSINLSNSKNWHNNKNSFRIDFGRKKGITFQIRNIQIRTPNKSELESMSEKVKKHNKEKKDAQFIKTYLNKRFPEKIDQISVNKKNVIFDFLVSKKCILGEIPMWKSLHDLKSLDDLQWHTSLEKGKHRISLKRIIVNDLGYDRVYSRWCLFEKSNDGLQMLSPAFYCNNEEQLAEHSFKVPDVKSKKGLQINWRPKDMGMLDELGIKHAAVNIELSSLLHTPKGTPYIEHNYLGKTFKINKNIIDNHSKVLSYSAKKEMMVGGILLIRGGKLSNPKIKKALQHPEYLSNGIYSMANVTSKDGVFYYAMLVDFLAKYFSNKENGFIHYWIIHNEVDAAWVWTNCGKRGPETMMDFYIRSMRTVHYTVKKYNPKAWVKISLTHYWNQINKHGPKDTMYAPKHLINILNDYCIKEGNFNWGLAYHPYPYNLRNPEVWKDPVTWDFNTNIISYKNLEVLAAYMKQDKYLFNGKRRKIYLTEQGFSNPNDSKQSLLIQAAAMAYGMKKVNGLEGIDAHILHRWVDHAREGGLNLGLVQKKKGTIVAVGNKKPSFDVYAAIDTDKENEVCKFALKIIGIKKWNEIFYSKEIR